MFRLRDAFRGVMLGGAVGDCMGAPLEFRTNGPMPIKTIQKQFDLYEKHSVAEDGFWDYTDDTAMAYAMASVLAKGQRNGDVDTRALAQA